MKPIKAIVVDADGTLLNCNHQIMPETKKALIKAQENGVKLVVASGRSLRRLFDIQKELEMQKHQGLLIAYNGSQAMDCQTKEIIYNQPISVEEGKAVLSHLKQFDIYPIIDQDDYMYLTDVFAPPVHYNGDELNIVMYESRGGDYLLCEKRDLAAFLDFTVNKILTFGEPEYLLTHYEAMQQPFKDSLNCIFTAPFYFEFTAKGIDKSSALKHILPQFNISNAEVISFGDSHNDLSMIEYAGIGVAMGNAVDEVKNTADYITATNDENGIVQALQHFLPDIKF